MTSSCDNCQKWLSTNGLTNVVWSKAGGECGPDQSSGDGYSTLAGCQNPNNGNTAQSIPPFQCDDVNPRASIDPQPSCNDCASCAASGSTENFVDGCGSNGTGGCHMPYNNLGQTWNRQKPFSL